MNEPDLYRRIESAQRAEVPARFADAVMRAIDSEAEGSWGTPALRAAAWVAAVAVLALRVGSALAVFWAA